MARDIGNIDMGAVLRQVGLFINFNIFARGRHAV